MKNKNEAQGALTASQVERFTDHLKAHGYGQGDWCLSGVISPLQGKLPEILRQVALRGKTESALIYPTKTKKVNGIHYWYAMDLKYTPRKGFSIAGMYVQQEVKRTGEIDVVHLKELVHAGDLANVIRTARPVMRTREIRPDVNTKSQLKK